MKNSVCIGQCDHSQLQRAQFTDLLAEDASNFLRMAVDGVKQPREAKAQNGTGEECREHNLLLPAHVCRRTRHEPHGDHDERHETCIIGTTTR